MEFRFPCPKEVSSKYSLLEELGSGGFAEIQIVRDKETKKTYVLKKVRKGAKFLEDMTKNVFHPHLIKVKERIFKGDYMYVVMQHMEGGDLYTKVAKQGALPTKLAKFYFFQILLAIYHLHDYVGMAHQNLKLQNVLLASSNEDFCRVRVSDYGVSSDDPARRNAKLWIAQMYDAARDGRVMHPYHVDMWSMGLVLAQCLTGSVLPEANLPRLKPSVRSLVSGMMDFAVYRKVDFVFDHDWLQDPEMWKKARSLRKNWDFPMSLKKPVALFQSSDEVCSHCGRVP